MTGLVALGITSEGRRKILHEITTETKERLCGMVERGTYRRRGRQRQADCLREAETGRHLGMHRHSDNEREREREKEKKSERR